MGASEKEEIGMRLVFAITMLVASATATFAQDVTLQYRWTKGEEIKYRLVQQTTTTISGFPGTAGEMNAEVNVTQVLQTRVNELGPDGAATLDYRFESARWEMKSPMFTMIYDSASPETSGAGIPAPMKDVLSAMIGQSLIVVVSPQGEVRKVEGADALFDKMIKSLPPNPAMAPMMQALRNSFSNEGMRTTLSQSYTQFPDRSLKPGDTWQSAVTAPNPIAGPVTTTIVFTLASIEGGGMDRTARITTKISVKNDLTAAPATPLGMRMQFGESTGDGEVVFDAARGRVRRATTRTTIPMEVSGTGADGNALSMRTVIASVITIELVP